LGTAAMFPWRLGLSILDNCFPFLEKKKKENRDKSKSINYFERK
jgi:hypothetical protein